MSERIDEVWKDAEFAQRYLDDISGAIPLEREQLDVMRRIIRHQRTSVKNFLDIGCGNGILSSVILAHWPDAQGVLQDFNETMLTAAKEKLDAHATQLRFVQNDYGDKKWVADLDENGTKKFDVVVSRFSIHHQPDQRKREVYEEIYQLLEPNGVFINIEHISSASKWGEAILEGYMVDYLHDAQLNKGKKREKSDIAQEFRDRHDKDANIVASVEDQCDWMREIGYTDVDCYFRVFEMAIFAGKR